MANEKFQNALNRKVQNTPPIWFMRQAGRYHQHYQKLKEKYTFMQLCKDPELAAEVALGPIEEFDFDISILFSDLLFPLEALGLGLRYDPGPVLDRHLDWQVLETLRGTEEAVEDLQFQKLAVQATRERLPKDKSLIGFVGGPWTLFTYAVEGAHKGNLIKAKTQFSLYQAFAEIMVPLLKKNIQLQLDGGAEVVMVLDTASGELSPTLFNHILLPHLNQLMDCFPGQLGYYSKGTTEGHLKMLLQQNNWAGLGVDHRWDLPQLMSSNIHRKSGFFQGNFDQVLLFSDFDIFKKRLDEFIAPFKELTPEQRAGWVCGLGHGVLPKTPEAHVKYFVEKIREVFS